MVKYNDEKTSGTIIPEFFSEHILLDVQEVKFSDNMDLALTPDPEEESNIMYIENGKVTWSCYSWEFCEVESIEFPTYPNKAPVVITMK